MAISDTITRLKEGNARFVEDKLDHKLQNSHRREELTRGQQPDAIILGCADSRVVPELAFDAGLGELFVVRVAGNVANESSIASIEYAVLHCGSNVILVLGHQSCGAVTAAVQGGDNGPHINHLLSFVQPAIKASGENASINDVVRINARQTKADLMDKSDVIRNAVNNGTVKIVPAYYNLDSGKVDFLED